tara:strand:+ start:329 stop:775 length:447 start_codon:yes stop_codon:yes gene_type:complete
LSGFITVNGVRVRLDWTLSGDRIIEGPGVSASEITLSVPLTAATSSTVEDSDSVHLTYNDGYEEITVTELRNRLSQRGQPIYGNKADLIARLRGWDASNPGGLSEEPEPEPEPEPEAEIEAEPAVDESADESEAIEEEDEVVEDDGSE